MGSHSNSRFLYLTTKGWKTGQDHKIEIWFVEHDKKYYIMSETLEKAHWVQNIKHNPQVKITLNNYTIKATARIIDKASNPKLESDILKLMSSKPVVGLIVELNPE